MGENYLQNGREMALISIVERKVESAGESLMCTMYNGRELGAKR
jgi:hypothetical protein